MGRVAGWHSGCVTATTAADPALPDALVELAAECGVATGYTDAHGADRDVLERTVRAVLAAMGVGARGPGGNDDAEAHSPEAQSPADDAEAHSRDAADRAALEQVRLTRWRRVLEPTVVATQGVARVVPIHVPLGATATVSAHLEQSSAGAAPAGTAPAGTAPTGTGEPDTHDPAPVALLPLGGERIQREVDGVAMEQISVRVPADLPMGWHRLRVVVVAPDTRPHPTNGSGATGPHPSGPADPGDPDTGARYEATLLVAPATIPIPADLDRRRGVGLAAQLYQVRSAQSWGIGDLADLADLAEWGGRDLGADFVLVNPLHAGEPYPPVSPSPYLPTTRRFDSALYLRPEQIPEYSELSGPARDRVDELARVAAGAGCNRSDLLDRDTSWTAKLEALRLLFAQPRSPGRAAEFDRFRRDGGPALRTYATWCALAAEHGPDWTAWPPELHDPDSEAVARFAADHREEVRFHKWLQWVTLRQRAHAHQAALAAGMRIGVLHDLAVGVHPTGADAWSLRHSLAGGVTVGAPPDVYNQRGQDWSQPPLRPDALAEDGYRVFRDIVRAALRDAGGVRIDHILGLFRLWWIPAGAPASAGTYVHYDAEAMLAVLALEATRAGAVVVGEDLGTVAPSVEEQLSDRGILGTSVMWFEQSDDDAADDDGDGGPAGGAATPPRPRAPETYRTLCMASLTTHDLAPTAGYAALVHVDIRHRLGQLTRPVEDERREAAAEVEGFVTAVRERGLLEGDSPADLVLALHRFVAASPSLLFAVSLADLVGDRRPVNMPGTSDEYPNWSVSLTDGTGHPVVMEDLRRAEYPGRVVDAINAVGAARHGTGSGAGSGSGSDDHR